MTSGSCRRLDDLPAPALALVRAARRAVLATVDDRGNPHAVPVSFAVRGDDLVTAVDQKPKSGRELARLANVRQRPAATLLLDRWDEDWTRLGWVMVRGDARIEPPGSATAELVQRYPQYRRDPPSGEVIALRPRRILWWLARDQPGGCSPR